MQSSVIKFVHASCNTGIPGSFVAQFWCAGNASVMTGETNLFVQRFAFGKFVICRSRRCGTGCSTRSCCRSSAFGRSSVFGRSSANSRKTNAEGKA